MWADVILETKGITKSYPMSGGKEITVLEDINIQIKDNEFVSILGPSGAGKSTFLRIMAGLSVPSSGEVFYHGLPLQRLRWSSRVLPYSHGSLYLKM